MRSFKSYLTEKTYRHPISGKSIKLTSYSQFGIPNGMAELERNNFDPDPNDGIAKKLDIPQIKQEYDQFGDGFYLHDSAGRALQALFSGLPRELGGVGLSQSNIRWAIRPVAINHGAASKDNSTHTYGLAVDIPHRQGVFSDKYKAGKFILHALESGFTGVGIGTNQTHVDTRNDFFGKGIYLYSYGLGGKYAQEAVIFAMLKDNWNRDDIKEFEVALAQLGNTSARGSLGGVGSMNALQVWKRIHSARNSYGAANSVATKKAEVPNTEEPPKPITQKAADPKVQQQLKNLTQLASGAAIVAALAGGFFFWRRFVRSRQQREELKQLMNDAEFRKGIDRLRMISPDLVDDVKKSNDARKELQKYLEMFNL